MSHTLLAGADSVAGLWTTPGRAEGGGSTANPGIGPTWNDTL
ncbi:hypothetical protein M2271_003261 [Streptomyces sp. LBL]|nr:hypothetical protein [Streptomyces sp. LBL]MDH6625450.1 hypothetical protein [Streptomyces sp. LBL]